jgi:glycosyltransferase involved in cell wall biosynthesis
VSSVSRIVLVQPRPGPRISGGYLYNARMAEHGAFQLENVDAAALPGAVAALSADVLLADSIWLTESSFAPFLEAAQAGRRVGVVMHSFPSLIAATEAGLPPPSQPTAFELSALEQVGLVVTPGPHYANLLRGRPIDVRIAEPGLADALRAPPRPRTGPCELVSIGAVTRRKGYLDVLEALAPRAAEASFRWTILGSTSVDPDYAAAVAERARAFRSVTLAGQLDPEEVCERVTASHVLVLPSYDENHPLVVLEAMAASVPTVAYAVGAVAQMIAHGSQGLIGPIGDRAALAKNLARLIDDEPERQRLAHACWQQQARLPSWREAGQRARALLER